MSKKILSILLTLTILIGVIAVIPVSAQEKEIAKTGFSIRSTPPPTSSPYYYNYSYNPFYTSDLVTQCTWYAWGRAYEIMGKRPNLSTNHAKYWFDYNRNNNIYSYSTNFYAAKPGAILCCDDGGYTGHVAIVEEVGANGAPSKISEGGWTGSAYYTANFNYADNYYGAQLKFHYGDNYNGGFQGYIYLDDIGNNPTSALDSVLGGTGTVRVSGWTFDRDDPTQSLSVHVYIGGSAGSPGAEGVSIPANQSRGDVDNAFHVGEFHGFDSLIPTSKTGNQDIYVYAINIGSGENTEIGHKTVYISPDTEKPTCNISYISQVTQNSFRVCAVPNDNVGIKEVRIATWTQSDQSDLIWHTANFNGSDTYFVNVNRADYSNSKNSLYYNHIYVYDYAGNYISLACNQDYKISSDTGKSVPEGEYRIITAINESRALDVANGSADSGANIQIYANFVSPKQTFSLSYLNNGFYTIANSFSGLVLDVAGDTYVNNTNVMQHASNGGANQEWMIKSSGDGYYYIISRTNGLALDVTNADDRDGANVAVHTQNQAAAQKWKLRRVLKADMVTITGWLPKGGIYQPTAKVVVDGQTLTKDVDYTVSTYIDNETLYAKITGIGNYCDSISVEYQEKTACIGDTDGDGDVSSIDATYILRYTAMMNVDIDEAILMNGDVDGNEELEVVDATYIQRYLAEFPIPYPIGECIKQ